MPHDTKDGNENDDEEFSSINWERYEGWYGRLTYNIDKEQRLEFQTGGRGVVLHVDVPDQQFQFQMDRFPVPIVLKFNSVVAFIPLHRNEEGGT